MSSISWVRQDTHPLAQWGFPGIVQMVVRKIVREEMVYKWRRIVIR
jgi:hypothetical protein